MRMSKHVVWLCVLLASSAVGAFAAGGTSSLTTSSQVLLGAPASMSAVAWLAGTAYVQGQAARVQGRQLAIAFVAGTSGTTMPALSAGTDTVDNGVTWRPMLPNPRKGLFLANLGSGDVTFAFGYTAVAGAGLVLASGEKILWSGVADTPQAAVSAIRVSGTNDVVALEW